MAARPATSMKALEQLQNAARVQAASDAAGVSDTLGGYPALIDSSGGDALAGGYGSIVEAVNAATAPLGGVSGSRAALAWLVQ